MMRVNSSSRMLSRANALVIVVSAGTFVGTVLDSVFLYHTGKDYFYPILGLFFAEVFGYACYRSLIVRKSLAVEIYRRLAFGIALLALVFGASFSIAYFSFYIENAQGLLGYFINGPPLEDVILLTLFYWLDRLILASRRSDPLYRDTLHWSKVRLFPWSVNVFSSIVAIGVALVEFISTGSFTKLNSLQIIGNNLFGPLISLTLFCLFLTAAIFLPFAIFRARRDMIMRKQLKWFGIFLLFFFLFFIFYSNANSLFGTNYVLAYSFVFLYYCAAGLAAFSLIRSARSLTPNIEKLIKLQ
jgi:hypothetical protein